MQNNSKLDTVGIERLLSGLDANTVTFNVFGDLPHLKSSGLSFYLTYGHLWCHPVAEEKFIKDIFKKCSLESIAVIEFLEHYSSWLDFYDKVLSNNATESHGARLVLLNDSCFLQLTSIDELPDEFWKKCAEKDHLFLTVSSKKHKELEIARKSLNVSF